MTFFAKLANLFVSDEPVVEAPVVITATIIDSTDKAFVAPTLWDRVSNKMDNMKMAVSSSFDQSVIWTAKTAVPVVERAASKVMNPVESMSAVAVNASIKVMTDYPNFNALLNIPAMSKMAAVEHLRKQSNQGVADAANVTVIAQ